MCLEQGAQLRAYCNTVIDNQYRAGCGCRYGCSYAAWTSMNFFERLCEHHRQHAPLYRTLHDGTIRRRRCVNPYDRLVLKPGLTASPSVCTAVIAIDHHDVCFFCLGIVEQGDAR